MTPIAKTLALALIGAACVLARPAQAVVPTGNLCFQETERTERTKNIPQHLLGAMALAESGRWDPDQEENVAWPWTVTSGGEGRFFPTKRAAVAEVRRMMAEGVTNIDVGCMQINLYHHGDHFVSLEHAFDPAANVAYAARFLTSLFKETKSWTKAASWYHSRTPDLADRYRAKVTRLWTERQQVARAEQAQQPVHSASADQTETPSTLSTRGYGALTERFHAHQAMTAGVRDMPADQATVRRTQLASWRNGDNAAALAQAQRLRREKAEMQKYQARRSGTDKAEFAAKRRSQLKAWRLRGVYASGGVDG